MRMPEVKSTEPRGTKKEGRWKEQVPRFRWACRECGELPVCSSPRQSPGGAVALFWPRTGGGQPLRSWWGKRKGGSVTYIPSWELLLQRHSLVIKIQTSSALRAKEGSVDSGRWAWDWPLKAGMVGPAGRQGTGVAKRAKASKVPVARGA